MPRPVSEFGGLASTGSSINIDPEFKSLVFKIISLAAESEITIAHFICSLFPDPAERSRVGEIFDKNRQRTKREGALSALAALKLSKEDAKTLDKIIGKIDAAVDKRDVFAHCRFGTAADKSVLVVLRARAAIDFYANFAALAPPPGPGLDPFVEAYTATELHQIIAELQTTTGYLSEFRGALANATEDGGKSMDEFVRRLDGKA